MADEPRQDRRDLDHPGYWTPEVRQELAERADRLRGDLVVAVSRESPLCLCSTQPGRGIERRGSRMRGSRPERAVSLLMAVDAVGHRHAVSCTPPPPPRGSDHRIDCVPFGKARWDTPHDEAHCSPLRPRVKDRFRRRRACRTVATPATGHEATGIRARTEQFARGSHNLPRIRRHPRRRFDAARVHSARWTRAHVGTAPAHARQRTFPTAPTAR